MQRETILFCKFHLVIIQTQRGKHPAQLGFYVGTFKNIFPISNIELFIRTVSSDWYRGWTFHSWYSSSITAKISTSEITQRDVRVGFIYKPDERHCTGDVGDVWSSSRSSWCLLLKALEEWLEIDIYRSSYYRESGDKKTWQEGI